MKRKFTIIIPIVALLLAGIVTACNEDDEPSEPTYAVKITNTTVKHVDLYLQADDGDVNKIGSLTTGANKEFEGMKLKSGYTLTATLAGEDEAEHFFEDTFSNSNPDVKSLNLDVY